MKLKKLLLSEVSLTGRQALTWSISRDELEAFVLLTSHGLELQTMLKIAFKEEKQILKALENGESLSDILCTHCRFKNIKILRVLAKHMPFQNAFSALERIEASSTALEKEMVKNCSYPAFLFCFSYFMIVFFTGSILPQMSAYDSGMAFSALMSSLRMFYTLLFFFLIAAAVFYLWFSRSENPPAFVKNCVLRVPLIQQIYTYQFAILFQVLLESGLNTRECINVLQESCFMKAAAIYYPQIENGLMKGKDFMEILRSMKGMDRKFFLFASSGMEIMTLAPLLSLYCSRTLLKIRQTTKKISVYVQIGAYSGVGILVLAVYQIMLMPLNMLNTL